MNRYEFWKMQKRPTGDISIFQSELPAAPEVEWFSASTGQTNEHFHTHIARTLAPLQYKQMGRKFIWLYPMFGEADGGCCRACFFRSIFLHIYSFIYLFAEVWMRWFVCVCCVGFIFGWEWQTIFSPFTRRTSTERKKCHHRIKHGMRTTNSRRNVRTTSPIEIM